VPVADAEAVAQLAHAGADVVEILREREVHLALVADRERRLAMIQAGVPTPSAVISDSVALEDAAEDHRAFDARDATTAVLTTGA